MMMIFAVIIATRAHEVSSKLPFISSDHAPSFTASAAQIESHPSHIEDDHQALDNLETHKVNWCSIWGFRVHKSVILECGDVEESRKMCESLEAVKVKSKIHIWPLPQQYTILRVHKWEDLNALSKYNDE